MDYQSSFKPPFWLKNPHLQTLWPTIFKRKKIKGLQLRKERIELCDGDFLDLVWADIDNPKVPIVLILHGLEGSIHSHYSKGFLSSINQQGWRGLLMHFRGCSEEPNRLKRRYHSGETEDPATIVKLLKSRYPHSPIAAIGISLGGNVLLKWLGETQDNNPLTAAIAISVPYELQKTAERIQKGFSKFYQWYLLKCLKKSTMKKYSKQPFSIDLNRLKKLKTLCDFDEYITAPLHGFSGKDEYYKLASSKQYLSHIKIPTLLIHAKDDPFTTQDIIPKPKELSACIKLEVTENGGHVGFIAGRYPWNTQFWLGKRTIDFLKIYLS